MTGSTNDKTYLNNTLLFITKLLNEHKIKDWFIGYGTLLGIIRGNSCIDGDDDVDIVINIENYDVVKQILTYNGIEIEYGYGINTSRNILKTKNTKDYCSVDFYMAALDKDGNYIDNWERVVWSKCYGNENKLIEYMWHGQMLYLPHNYTQKLINRYGETWNIPQDSKGIFPRKRIL
jgi:hypothetical protein